MRSNAIGCSHRYCPRPGACLRRRECELQTTAEKCRKRVRRNRAGVLSNCEIARDLNVADRQTVISIVLNTQILLAAGRPYRLVSEIARSRNQDELGQGSGAVQRHKLGTSSARVDN